MRINQQRSIVCPGGGVGVAAAMRLAAALLVALGLGGCQTTGGGLDSEKISGQDRLVEAQRYQTLGLEESALAAFTLALQENPTLTDAVMGVADIQRQRGNYAQASQMYQRAIELEPASFDAHYYLGLMQQLMGQVAEAIRTYLRALALNPQSFDANQHLASAYMQVGRPADALPYAVRATELNPESQAAWANLAATYSLLSQFEEAVDAYRQAAELGEIPEPVMLGLADAHIRLGNFERAVNVLETLLRINPTSLAHERMGYAQFKMRLYPESLASFRTSLRMNPAETAALNGAGVVLMTIYIQGNRADTALRDEAITAWRKSVQLHPRQPRILDLISRYQRL
jgi:tetratricopeptide (TPR) repeat protein